MHYNYNQNWMDDAYETQYMNVNQYNSYTDDCMCGFEPGNNLFPDNPMFGQSYVPWQRMGKTFTPGEGLKMGTIFPELVSPYMPGQSMEEIEYLRNTNKMGEGCNG